MLECERQNLIEQFKRQRAQLHVIEANLLKLKHEQLQKNHQLIKNEKGNQEEKCDILIIGESPSPAYSSISLTSTSNSIDVSHVHTKTTTTRFDSVPVLPSISAASSTAENQIIFNQGSTTRGNINDVASLVSSRPPISTAFLNSFGQMHSENLNNCDNFQPSFQSPILTDFNHRCKLFFSL